MVNLGEKAGMTMPMSQSDKPIFQPAARHPDAWKTRDHYRVWGQEHVRFADLDPLGHVNNNSYGVYFEAARVKLISSVYPDFWKQPVLIVLRSIHIEYHAELHYPNDLQLGGRIEHIGNSSLSASYGVFVGDKCFATAQSTGILIDRETRRPVPVPEELRRAVADYM